MAVLSDGEIRRLINAGGLIEGGDLARASECSYSFVPGAAFLPGADDLPVEFPGPNGRAEVIVKPGQMIWIRTLERVKVPDDLVGFWWQTNALSRKGLMLVNMSMIEPGYEGDLACLFVNFGKSNVPVGPTTIIAKMVFQDLRGTLIHPYLHTVSRSDYDRHLRELTIDQPKSFLQVGDLAIDLAKARTEALDAIQKSGLEAAATTAKQMNEVLEAIRKSAGDAAGAATKQTAEALETIQKNADAAIEAATKQIGETQVDAAKTFRDDIPKAVLAALPWAIGALALMTAATLGADQIKGALFPDNKAIAEAAAEETLKSHQTIDKLNTQIDDLNKRIATLEKHK